MKQKIAQIFIFLLASISLIFIFMFNKPSSLIIIDACNIFLTKVFVSLFPMFILNDIFIWVGLPILISKIFTPIFKKFFHTSGTISYVFFMSMLSGTPSNVYILKELLNNNEISSREANHALYFTYFSNPLFLYTMLNLIFNIKTTLKIILSHYLANAIIGILLRKKAPTSTSYLKAQNSSYKLTESIKKSMNTLLIILGTIVFYMLLTYIIVSILPLPPIFNTLITGLLEITNGLNSLIKLNTLLSLKETMATFIISFGGLSIHTQIKAIMEDTNLNYKCFLKGRILQTIISVILVLII